MKQKMYLLRSDYTLPKKLEDLNENTMTTYLSEEEAMKEFNRQDDNVLMEVTIDYVKTDREIVTTLDLIDLELK